MSAWHKADLRPSTQPLAAPEFRDPRELVLIRHYPARYSAALSRNPRKRAFGGCAFKGGLVGTAPRQLSA